MHQSPPAPSRRLWLAAGALTLAFASSASAWSWPFGATLEGNGQKTQQVRAVTAFDRVRINDAVDLEWRQGTEERVEVFADANLQPLVQVKVEGGELNVTMDTQGKSWRTINPLKVVVTSRSVKALTLLGSGDAWVGPVQGQAFSAMLKGSGNLKLSKLQAQRLDLDLLGSGDVRADGATTQLNIRLKGSGDVQCRDLVAEDGDVELTGSGDIAVRAERTLKASVRGSGDIQYSGKVARVDADVRGSGSITRVGS